MKTKAYLDYSATTPVRKEALKSALPFFTEKFGNPSSFHSTGLEAKLAMKEARERISKILNCTPEEIIFTGSGTESINLAIKGIAFKSLVEGKKGTFITQKTEHHAVLETLDWLEKLGFKKIELDVDENGILKLEQLKKTLAENKDTLLVTMMYANNEIGTIQPLEEISKICKSHNVPLHTDACQGAEYLSLDTKKLGVDMMTINGSKVYSFKGTGLLYKRKDLKLEPIITGGSHEFNLRAGTENVAGIVALATALDWAEKEKKKEGKRLSALRDYFISKVKKEIPAVRLNGHPTQRLPNNINISFEGVEGESIMLRLNEEGIRVSTGSACTSQSLEPSHVLLALGLSHELAHGSIRFSLGKGTDKKQLDYTLKKLKSTIKFLRGISPVWRDKE